MGSPEGLGREIASWGGGGGVDSGLGGVEWRKVSGGGWVGGGVERRDPQCGGFS